jgi:hypothetical protein
MPLKQDKSIRDDEVDDREKYPTRMSLSGLPETMVGMLGKSTDIYLVNTK